MATLDFKLVRPARSQGGDRYESGREGEDGWMVVYIPQSISRAEDGQPKKAVTITIE